MDGAFFDRIVEWLQVAQFLATVVFFIALLWLRSMFVTRKEYHGDIEKIRADLMNHAARLITGDGWFDRLNDRLKELPKAKDVGDLEVSIVELRGEIRVTNERLDGVEKLHETLKHQVAVMDDYFRKSK